MVKEPIKLLPFSSQGLSILEEQKKLLDQVEKDIAELFCLDLVSRDTTTREGEPDAHC